MRAQINAANLREKAGCPETCFISLEEQDDDDGTFDVEHYVFHGEQSVGFSWHGTAASDNGVGRLIEAMRSDHQEAFTAA